MSAFCVLELFLKACGNEVKGDGSQALGPAHDGSQALGPAHARRVGPARRRGLRGGLCTILAASIFTSLALGPVLAHMLFRDSWFGFL